MIREFEQSDLERFEPNQVSDPSDQAHVFDDDRWWKYTIYDKEIKAIICFLEDQPGEWGAFAFISKHFNARDSVEMRKFMQRAEDVLKPKKLWTASPSSAKVNRWHEFLNLTLDSPLEYNGKIYNKWVRA